MRLNIKISDELYQQVENYAYQFGMSKSAFVAYCVGSAVKDLNDRSKIVDMVASELIDRYSDFSPKGGDVFTKPIL